MDDVRFQAIENQMDVLIIRHRDFLKERIDPDFGLLDELHERGALSLEEISEIKNNSYLHERNSTLLHYILMNRNGDRLLWALIDANQIHIANCLNPEYAPHNGGEWPLTSKEISILDTNREILADLLDLRELVGLLLSRNVINIRQMDFVSSKSTSHEKAEMLLEILRRRSINDYKMMINCLHQTNQSHIAEILSKGGVPVRVCVTLFGDEVEQTEEEIVTRLKSHLLWKTAEARITTMAGVHIIAVEKSLDVSSFVLYSHCMSVTDLTKLHDMLITGELKTEIEEMFCQLLSPSQFSEVTSENLKPESVFTHLLQRSQIPSFKVTLLEDDYKKYRSIFLGDIKLRAVSDFGPQQISGREENDLRNTVESKRKIGDARLSLCEYFVKSQSVGYCYFKRDIDLEPLVLSFEKGNKLETLAPTNIGDDVGWWIARHLESGHIGFVPRNRVMVDRCQEMPREKYIMYSCHKVKRRKLMDDTTEQNGSPSTATLYDLPLEILDIILQKSYMHWVLYSMQRDEEVIRSLISVDVCFYRRITGRRFKKTIWRYLKDFYGKARKRLAIIRNNRNYLLENIKPNEKFISSLLSLYCITPKEGLRISRRRRYRNRNDTLLNVLRSLNKERLSNFMKCLRQTNQKTVARIIENGGGVINIKVKSSDFAAKMLHQNIESLRCRTEPLLEQTDKLREEGIEILNSQLDRQTVVVWIWCHSQTAQDYIRRLHESNQLRDVFVEYTQPSSIKMTDIDTHQFKKTMVVCAISINLSQRIEIPGYKTERVRGITKLRNEIYILYKSTTADPCVIRVFEDRYSLRLRKEIKIKEMRDPFDIGSSDKNNCLYVSDYNEKCIRKITRETEDEYKISKWLITDYKPHNLSVSSDGQLLVVDQSSSILCIYGSDAELIRSIQLKNDIRNPAHAVKTCIGNFIISHTLLNEELGSAIDVISELTSDGQMVVRRFIPSSETQELYQPRYLSLDSDDQVFVAEYSNDRVILLDSDLKWSRTLLPPEKDDYEMMKFPLGLLYDVESEQLFVCYFIRDIKRHGVNVYTVTRF